MTNRPWLDEVRERLARQRLPAAYLRRFMDELSDHYQDITEDTMSTEIELYSRLGEPEQVAEAAVTAFRQRSFLKRHPTAAFLVFCLTPVVPQIGLGFVVAFIFAAIFNCIVGPCGINTNELGPVTLAACQCFFGLTILLCTCLASVLYGELATRSGVSRKWMFLSCPILGAIAVHWQYTLQDGIGFQSLLLIPQFIAPLAAGWWFARRKPRQSYCVTNFFIFAVSPLVSLAFIFFVAYFLLFLVGKFISFPAFNDESFGRVELMALACLFNLLSVVVPLIAASLLYCKLAMRFDLGNKWMLVSCAFLGLLGTLFCFSVTSADANGHFFLQNGFWLSSPMQLVHLMVPLAIGWWFLRRKREEFPKTELRWAA